IGPDPRNFNQRVSLGRNDLLIRTFLKYAVQVVSALVAVKPGAVASLKSPSAPQNVFFERL
ncbi:hypothetical protein ACQE7F_27620, partial [Klebsiella pneumoniae]